MEAMAFLLGIVAGWQWGYFWADARRQIRENRMSEFRVGDRARVKYGTDWGLYEGQEGTLGLAPEADSGLYHRLILDGEPEPWDGGLPVNPDEIEPLDG